MKGRRDVRRNALTGTCTASGKSVEAKGQARLVTRGRIGVKDPFVDRVIDQGESRLEQPLGRCLILLVEGFPKLAHLMPKPGAVHAIKRLALEGLFDAVQSGSMTCHGISS